MSAGHCTQHIAVISLRSKPDHTSGPVEWRATEQGYRGNSYKARVRSEVQTQFYRNAQAKRFTKIAVVCVCVHGYSMCSHLTYPWLHLSYIFQRDDTCAWELKKCSRVNHYKELFPRLHLRGNKTIFILAMKPDDTRFSHCSPKRCKHHIFFI